VSMRDRPRLGRGLKDVSRYFLADSHPRGGPDPVPTSEDARPISVFVFHASSPEVQSLLTLALAMETARLGRGALIWDGMAQGAQGVKRLAGGLLARPGGRDKGGGCCIRLYGLGAIPIHDAACPVWSQAEASCLDLPGDGDTARGELLVFVNASPDMGFFTRGDLPDHTVIAARTDERSLLKAYACMRVMDRRAPGSRMYLVLEAHGGEPANQCDRTFEKLASFARENSKAAIAYLGCLIADDETARSIHEADPLALMMSQSPAGASLRGVCSRFLDLVLAGETP